MYIRFTIVNARQDDPLKYSVHEDVFEKGALVKCEKHKNLRWHTQVFGTWRCIRKGGSYIMLFKGNKKEGILFLLKIVETNLICNKNTRRNWNKI